MIPKYPTNIPWFSHDEPIENPTPQQLPTSPHEDQQPDGHPRGRHGRHVESWLRHGEIPATLVEEIHEVMGSFRKIVGVTTPVIINFCFFFRMFHLFEPSSYWGTTMAMEAPIWLSFPSYIRPIYVVDCCHFLSILETSRCQPPTELMVDRVIVISYFGPRFHIAPQT